MSSFPEELIHIAAMGSNPRAAATLEQSRFSLLEKWENADSEAERELLISIAAYSLQNQAGYTPNTHSDHLLPKVAEEENPSCSVTAQQHLKLMLDHVHEELLPHWIEAVHKHEQRIPHEMLPLMLDYGSKKSPHHALLKNALGERGRWLAHQSKLSKWEWILKEESLKPQYQNHYPAWENYFRRFRQRDPKEALHLLQKHWDDLDSLMQVALLNEMGIGLNNEDADFLASVFEAETIRFTAARWLLKIEESEITMQARENIGKLLALIQVGHQNQWVVDYTWSSSFTGHPQAIKRHDANALSNILGYEFNPELMGMLLPLSYWYDTYNVTPDILVTAARNSTRPNIFYRFWSQMAVEDDDLDFLFALVMNVERHESLSLVHHLSQEQLMQAATHWLKKKPIFSLQHNATTLLNTIRETWTLDLAETFLDSLERCFKRIPRPLLDKNMRQKLKQYARLLPLSVNQRFEQVLHINERGDLSGAEIEQLNGIIDIGKFRADMMNAIIAGTKNSPTINS